MENSINKIKITEEELVEIRNLQTKYQDTQFAFGKLYLEKMQIDNMLQTFKEKEAKLQEKWEKCNKLEQDTLDKLLKKYGEGQLDIKEGVFIAEKSIPEKIK
jgi:hypothetical protein